MLQPLLVLSAFLLLAFASQQSVPAAPDPAAQMPADAAQKTNPIKPTAASQAAARKMYGYDCALCHGANGDGKGEVAMKTPLKDLTDPATMKDISDGEIFYIIKNGKGAMDGEGARMKDDAVWNMVVLVRSFAKK